MINQFRADFYRQIHTITIYVLAFLVIVLAFLTVKYESVGGIMMTGAIQNGLDQVLSDHWTQILAVRGLTVSSSLLLYVFFAIFVTTFGTEFVQKTYKSSLTSGISRTNFLFSKYLLMLLNIFILDIIYFLTGILTSYFLGHGIGVNFSNLVNTTLGTSLVISFFISVLFGVTTLLLLITNSIVISSVFIIVFPVIVTMIHTLFKWDWLKYLDFFSITTQFTIKQVTLSDMIPYLEVGLALLIASYVLSNFLLHNKEL